MEVAVIVPEQQKKTSKVNPWASMCILFQKLSRNKNLAHSKMVHFFLSSISTVKLRSNSKNDLYVIQMARSVNDHVKATGNKVSFFFPRRIRCVLVKIVSFYLQRRYIYICLLLDQSNEFLVQDFSATLFDSLYNLQLQSKEKH